MTKKRFFEGNDNDENEGQKIIKKDFVLKQNEYLFYLRAGEPLPEDVPERFLQNLKTEGVI